MTDDGVREVHGVRCLVDDGWVTLVADEALGDKIRIDHCYKERTLTPPQARHLASKLYRLARRIEQRQQKAA